MNQRASQNPAARAIAPAVLAAGALIGQQVAAKATRDAFFLSHFDVQVLPTVMGLAALVSLAAVLGFSRALVAFSPARVVPLTLAGGAGLLFGEWLVSLAWPRLAALLLYVHTAVFGAALVSAFWLLLSERFDPHAARRAMPPIGTGANVGAVLGGLVAWRAAPLISLNHMLLVLAAFHLLCLAGVLRLRPSGGTGPRPDQGGSPAATSGLHVLAQMPYLRHLALIVGLGAFIQALLDYVLSAAAAARYDRGAELMAFFAVFHTAVGVLAFAAQAGLTRASLERLGLAGTVALQPGAVVLAGVLAALSPRLWTAVILRGAEAVLRNSLARSGYELLYTPLSPEKKRPAKTIVDVGFDRVGTAAGSLVLTAALALGPGSAQALPLLAAAAALGALVLYPRVQRGYVAALAESLRTGAIQLDSGEIWDSTTRRTLVESQLALDRQTLLQQIEARRRSDRLPEAASTEGPRAADPVLRSVAELRSADASRIRLELARHEQGDSRLLPHVIPLLAREDLLADALRFLRRAAPVATGQLIDALVDGGQELAVRSRIPRALRACATQRAVDGLLLGLGDESFEVRYQCALALLRLTELNSSLAVPTAIALSAALRELEGREHDPRRLEHVFTILALALEREPVQIAFRALRGADPALRGTALEYLENVLPEPLRTRLPPLLGTGSPAVRPVRPAGEAREALLRSSASLELSRAAVQEKLREED